MTLLLDLKNVPTKYHKILTQYGTYGLHKISDYQYIMNKVRVVSLSSDMPIGPYLPASNIIKIFQTIKKLWSAQEFGLEILSGEITRKKKNKARVVLLASNTPT